MMGVSVCRNANLANVFYRLQLIEAYGTGMQKIITSYRDKNCDPQIETSDNAFKIILPNINYTDSEKSVNAEINPTEKIKGNSSEQTIIDYLQDNKTITRADVEEIFTCKISKI